MILAGDIGGTKTVLALFSAEKGVSGGALHESRYQSSSYDSLESIIEDFLRDTDVLPAVACFGVAGPIENQTSQITNLPWRISARQITERFGIPAVRLINDLESLASAVPYLDSADLCTLNPGVTEPNGNIAVIAPGTGLGAAFLVWTGTGYKALASEGGHTSFSPYTSQEIELLKYLQPRYSHVSFERICSGSHFPNIYEFLLAKGGYTEPHWLKKELADVRDRTPIIVEAALAHKADICVAALDMFIGVLGSAISNMAITILPMGGIYLGGGIPPRILPRLKQPDFLKAIAHKGRFFELSAKMPVKVIMTAKAGLFGAARVGEEIAG